MHVFTNLYLFNLFLGEKEQFAVKIINKPTAILEASTCEKLENKMNQSLLGKLHQQSIVCRIESVFQMLNCALKEVHTQNPSQSVEVSNNSDVQSTSSRSKKIVSHKAHEKSRNSKKPPMKTALDVINR